MKGVPADNQTSDALTEEGKIGPSTGEKEVSCAQVEKSDARRVKGNVEAILDVCDDCVLVDIVVSCVDDANSLGISLLCSSNGSPEDSLTTTSCIAVIVSALYRAIK